MWVCVCVFTEADIHPGTVCHRLSCRKRPIISSHGSSGGVKCVICVGSNWQPTLVEADWGEGWATVAQPPPTLTHSPPFTDSFGNVTLCCLRLFESPVVFLFWQRNYRFVNNLNANTYPDTETMWLADYNAELIMEFCIILFFVYGVQWSRLQGFCVGGCVILICRLHLTVWLMYCESVSAVVLLNISILRVIICSVCQTDLLWEKPLSLKGFLSLLSS